MSKTFGEMTPEERKAATDRATTQLQAELQANAGAIGKIMDEALTDGHWPFARMVEFVCDHKNKHIGRACPGPFTSKVIACECGWNPSKPSARYSMQHVAHMGHRRKLGLQPVEYEWPDESYLEGLSTGGYIYVAGHEWRDGGWVRS